MKTRSAMGFVVDRLAPRIADLALASWFVRLAFIEPVCLTMLIVRFHTTSQGQAIDASVRAALDAAPRAVSSTRRLASPFE